MGQLGSPLSEKWQLCKKDLKYQVVCQKKNLRRATSGTRAIGSPPLKYNMPCLSWFCCVSLDLFTLFSFISKRTVLSVAASIVFFLMNLCGFYERAASI